MVFAIVLGPDSIRDGQGDSRDCPPFVSQGQYRKWSHGVHQATIQSSSCSDRQHAEPEPVVVGKIVYQNEETTAAEEIKPYNPMARSKKATAQGVDPYQEQNGHHLATTRAVEHRDCRNAARERSEVCRIVARVDFWEDAVRGKYVPVSDTLKEWWRLVGHEVHGLCVRGVRYSVHD